MLTTPKQENSTGTWWWTLSPLNYSGYAYLFHNHGKYDWDMGVVTYALRPSIAIISTTTISSGTGTSSDPFVIN